MKTFLDSMNNKTFDNIYNTRISSNYERLNKQKLDALKLERLNGTDEKRRE